MYFTGRSCVFSGESKSIERITAGGAAAALERLAGTDLVERGCVTIISVDAIRQRSGDRWPRKRDAVWAYVGKRFDEHLAYQDIRHRIGETDFLVAVTSEEGVAAQALSLKILEEALLFFLGVADPADMKIRAVSAINGQELACTDIDPAGVTGHRPAPPEELVILAYRPTVDPVEERRRNPISFVTASGQNLRIDYSLEEAVSLRHKVTAALRIELTVTHIASGRSIPARAFAKLSDDDIAFIDRASLDYAALFVGLEDRPQPLILPLSFRTLSTRKGRQALISAEGLPPQRVKVGVMVELIDVDRGTPEARLLEVTGLVGQLCKGVLVRLQPGRDAVGPVKGARLQGLTVAAGDLGGTDSQVASHMLNLASQARGRTPVLMIHGLPSEGYLDVAQVAGFTHASLRVAQLNQASEQPAA
ncbi:MAG: hypothetical protein Q7U11_25520 [Phenylobacterium sp.]|uniref:hypothetical protein n=1 Tax=Phenylobacterium sp. TaxID=1871053 RepID=UPI00271D654B|nr:hypothetical protein [Phenylobacterium sp.]MDO9249831.1 hypothetical protein [Phenylobacterium sp.]MDP3635596.1 hypothetical protein [Phenylobacterium sp.]MDP3867512.1 hypothetical protein [Phenylobacterium sp.]HQT54813.1 hypothetical protein [Phenylobacterium sp.]